MLSLHATSLNPSLLVRKMGIIIELISCDYFLSPPPHHQSLSPMLQGPRECPVSQSWPSKPWVSPMMDKEATGFFEEPTLPWELEETR